MPVAESTILRLGERTGPRNLIVVNLRNLWHFVYIDRKTTLRLDALNFSDLSGEPVARQLLKTISIKPTDKVSIPSLIEHSTILLVHDLSDVVAPTSLDKWTLISLSSGTLVQNLPERWYLTALGHHHAVKREVHDLVWRQFHVYRHLLLLLAQIVTLYRKRNERLDRYGFFSCSYYLQSFLRCSTRACVQPRQKASRSVPVDSESSLASALAPWAGWGTAWRCLAMSKRRHLDRIESLQSCQSCSYGWKFRSQKYQLWPSHNEFFWT